MDGLVRLDDDDVDIDGRLHALTLSEAMVLALLPSPAGSVTPDVPTKSDVVKAR